MKQSTKKVITVSVGAMLATGIAAMTGTYAQETDDTVADDTIIVTAQRREANLQEVPAAVTAIGAADLEQRQVSDVLDLQYQVPNISLATNTGTASGARIFLRGVGEDESRGAVDPAVGIYVDGIYLGRAIGGLLDITDLAQVEVLRGPQGTLYGRNTNGGAIKLVSQRPTDGFGGSIKVTAGNFERRDARATLNLPLSENTGFRVNALYRTRDGFHDVFPNGALSGQNREVGEQDTVSIRGILEHDFGNGWGVLVSADYTDDSSDPIPDSALDDDIFTIEPSAPCTAGSTAIGCFLDYRSDVETEGVSASITGRIGTFDFASLTGFRTLDDELNTRISFPYSQETDQDQLSQEFTLTSNYDGPFNFVSGLYYYEENVDLETTFISSNVYDIETESISIFGHGTYDITESLTLTGGARYTDEDRTFDGTVNFTFSAAPNNGPQNRLRDTGSTNTNFNIGLDYQVSDDLLVYVSYADSFKSAGVSPDCFNQGTPSDASTDGCYRPVDQEDLGSFELGVRSDLFDDRLRLNATYFANQYDGLQIGATTSLGFTRFNVDEAEIQGLEVETSFALTEDLDIYANFGLLDAEYSELDNFQALSLLNCGSACPADVIGAARDLELKNAPEYKGAIGIAYSKPLAAGNLSIAADYGFEDTSFSLVSNTTTSITDPGTILNARIGFASNQGWNVAVWGRNLADEEFSRVASGNTVYASPPLTYGVDLGVDF